MSTNTKFMFDTEFGASAGASSRRKKQPALYSEEDAALMKSQAYEDGLKSGQAQAQACVESNMASLIETMGTQLSKLMSNRSDQLADLKKETASLALVIAEKIAPALLQVAPQVEVIRMIEDCLTDLPDEPRVVVRASEQVTEALTQKIEQIATRAGYPGNIILLPDPEMQASDCRIEWADGGVERNMEEIQKRLGGLVDRFVHADGSAES